MSIASLSPTACATRIVNDICSHCQIKDRQFVLRLIRQLVRDQYEHCAQVAEHWVPENDLYEDRSGLEVGDAIAEEIRRMADERAESLGSVAELADAPALGAGAERRVGSTPSAPMS